MSFIPINKGFERILVPHFTAKVTKKRDLLYQVINKRCNKPGSQRLKRFIEDEKLL